MPYAFDLLMGADTAPTTGIVSVVGQVVTFSGLPTDAVVGRLFQYGGSAVGNDGYYTAINIAGSAVTVSEAINPVGVPDGLGRFTLYGVEHITSGPAITSFPDAKTVRVNTAAFETNDAHVGDRLAIYGDANNDGSYIVTKVVNQTDVEVVDRYLNANPLTVAAATGNIRLTAGYGKLTITDIAVLSWAVVAAGVPNLPIKREPVGSNMTNVRIPTLREIEIVQTGATSSKWDSQEEVVLPYRSVGDTVDIDWTASGGSALRSTLQLGTAGSAEYGVSEGAYWIGSSFVYSNPNNLIKLEAYGSALHTSGASTIASGTDGKFRTALINRATVTMFAGSEVRNLGHSSAGFAIVVGTATADIENLFMAKGTSGFVVAGGGTVIVSNFRVSTDVATPAWLLLLVNFIARDPQEDYSLARLFGPFGSETHRIDYTWNPRFLSRDSTGLTGNPIQGLTVRVYDINETTLVEVEIPNSPFITDVNGRINGGVGDFLQARSGPTDAEYSQRVTVEGAGFRAINMIIKMRSPLDVDIPVDFLTPDFEGEGFST
jgi:hypothetical protein